MDNKIIFDNCFFTLPNIEASSINLVLIDPPYLISRESYFKKGSKSDKQRQKFDLSLDFGEWDKENIDIDKLFTEFYRVLKPGGSLIVFYDIWKCGDIKYSAEKAGFKQPRVCQWVKNNPVPINSKRNYLSNAVEFFFTFVKEKGATFNSLYDKGIYNYPLCHGKERTEHPTQKPLELIKDLIKKHTNEGDLVLDSFAGSGTTGDACLELNRKFILIENNKQYIDIINKRLKK